MNTKLPDKIYIREYKLNEKSMFGDRYGITPLEETPRINNVEFIRKDTLLKWAKKELESARQTDFDEFGRGEVITLESIIKKLNSL